ncbi:MAG: alpha/beta hydrolase [Candidatus Izimaplasma sp.]|nr:alpha/beta hydrolase [Candidatus Izimaplasma bacterium]
MFKNWSKSLLWFVVLLLVVFTSSFFATMVQNSFFSVDVDKVSFETERGELSGYIYRPRDVDADNPAPAVVLTHGYLNNAEMQEIGAIELSRRGYVVLAFDMYDHGDSTWDTSPFGFYVHAVYDAVQYMYDKEYVLKDAAGNGMIGVSGHSMGGFSSTYAVIWDNIDQMTDGYRKIALALPVGSDYRYVYATDPWDAYGSRTAGHIAAHYDQFFFDNSADPVGSVIYKDFVEDEVGLEFLGKDEDDNPEAGTYYIKDGGQRVIFTPDETHPQNTWSLESGSNMIEFFERGFTYQLAQAGLGQLEDYGIETGKTGQTWWLKEGFTLIGLIALFALIFPAFAIVSKLPVFIKAYNTEYPGQEEAELPTKQKKYMKFFVILLTTLIAAYYLVPFMNRASLTPLADLMYYILGGLAFITLSVWIATAVVKGINAENKEMARVATKVTTGAIIIAFVALVYRWLLTNTDIVTETVFWSAPSVNTIVYWAMASAGLLLLVVLGTSYVFNYGQDVENPYGLKVTLKQLLASFLTALVLTFGILFIVALVEWIFLTDFRFYTYAVKIFNSHQFVAALRYMPLFFFYFLAAAMAVFANTRNMKGWKADLLAAFLLAGPVVIFLVYQYGTLYATGVAAYPTFSLSGILAMGLVPTLAVAGVIMRRFSNRTGNIWTSVFFTTMFFILITLANTTVYLITLG